MLFLFYLNDLRNHCILYPIKYTPSLQGSCIDTTCTPVCMYVSKLEHSYAPCFENTSMVTVAFHDFTTKGPDWFHVVIKFIKGQHSIVVTVVLSKDRLDISFR